MILEKDSVILLSLISHVGYREKFPIKYE